MKSNFSAIGFVLIAVFCVANTQRVHYAGPYDVFISAFMRFGTECILNESCGRKSPYANGTKTLDAFLNLDRTANGCFQHFSKDIEIISQNQRDNQISEADANKKLEKTAEVYCPAVLDLAECLKPVETLTKKCGGIEAPAFIGLVKFLCENDAKKFKDLIRADVMTCFQENTSPVPKNGQISPFQACLDHYFNDKYHGKELEGHIVKNTCKAVSNAKICGFVALDQCLKEYSQAKRLVEAMLQEMSRKIPETGKCFSQESPGPAKPRPTPKPQTNGNQKNWRPKYKG